MKKIIAFTLAVMMLLCSAVTVFGYYSEAEGYSTKVEDEEYNKKFF